MEKVAGISNSSDKLKRHLHILLFKSISLSERLINKVAINILHILKMKL